MWNWWFKLNNKLQIVQTKGCKQRMPTVRPHERMIANDMNGTDSSSFDFLKKVDFHWFSWKRDRQTDGLTHNWTDRPSHEDVIGPLQTGEWAIWYREIKCSYCSICAIDPAPAKSMSETPIENIDVQSVDSSKPSLLCKKQGPWFFFRKSVRPYIMDQLVASSLCKQLNFTLKEWLLSVCGLVFMNTRQTWWMYDRQMGRWPDGQSLS